MHNKRLNEQLLFEYITITPHHNNWIIFYMSLMVRYFCCTRISSRVFWRRGREKLLEICLDTVSAVLKVYLFRIINMLSLLNKRICRFGKRFYDHSSPICRLKTCFAARLDHIYMLLPQIILHNRPTLRMPIITKEKNISAFCMR